MKANKYTIGVYSTNERYCEENNMTSEEYRDFYYNQPVYVILRDEKIITKCKNHHEFFNEDLFCGCFIDNISKETPEEVEKIVKEFKEKWDLEEVSVQSFKAIEKQNQNQRVKKAFDITEKIIADDWEME